MIESLNRDVFDAVFFFEEEFNKTDQCKMMYFYEKDLVVDVLKHTFGEDIDLSELKMRGSSIWRTKKEEKNNLTDPIFRVWFVSGVYLNEKIIEKHPRFIIHIPSAPTQMGDLIILEDFFKYFFSHKLYIYFDKDCNILPLQPEEEKLFELQNRFIKEFSNLLKFLNDRDGVYFATQLGYVKFFLVNTPEYIRNSINLNFSDLLTLASIRRWLRSSFNHLMNNEEFDDNVIVPFVASFLYSRAFYLDHTIYWNQPSLVKVTSKLVIEMMNVLESAKLRSLDLTRRYLEYSNTIKNLDPSKYCDIKELEGIIKNVREEDSRETSRNKYPRKSSCEDGNKKTAFDRNN